jgi:hypothetical protein
MFPVPFGNSCVAADDLIQKWHEPSTFSPRRVRACFGRVGARPKFCREYADKNYQKGSAAFQMSIEESGNNTQI